MPTPVKPFVPSPLSLGDAEMRARVDRGEVPFEMMSTNDQARTTGLSGKVMAHPSFPRLKRLVDTKYSRREGAGSVYHPDPERAYAYLTADLGAMGGARSLGIIALQRQIAKDSGVALSWDVGKFKGITVNIPDTRPSHRRAATEAAPAAARSEPASGGEVLRQVHENAVKASTELRPMRPTKYNSAGTMATEFTTDDGRVLTYIASGKKKGKWRTQVGQTEYIGKTPAGVYDMSHPVRVAKEPWRRTRAEYNEWYEKTFGGKDPIDHIQRVARALQDGKPVPAEVLHDYPTLAVKAPEPVGVVGTRLVKEQPDVFVLYREGEPIAHIKLERYGPDRSGANLNWLDATGKQHTVHFAGATEESVARMRPEDALARMGRSLESGTALTREVLDAENKAIHAWYDANPEQDRLRSKAAPRRRAGKTRHAAVSPSGLKGLR